MDNYEKKNKKILITGGHLTPAWITAKELQKKGVTNLVWVGIKHTQSGDISISPEYQLVSELNIPFVHFNAGKLWRKWNRYTFCEALKDLLLIPLGFLNAFIIVFKQKPDIIISFGGYVALPIVVAAKLLAKKIITHEQVLKPGLANRIIAIFANKILISWEQTKKYFSQTKTVLTGNPSWILAHKNSNFKIEFNNKLPIISFIGGNQGASVINTAIFAILEDLLKITNVIHQTGRSEVTKDKYKAVEIKINLPSTLATRYVHKPYIVSEEIYETYDKADLIIARGGANTMTDIIAKTKKCIIIPIPWSANNEQLANAKFLEKLNLGTIITYEREINPELLLKEIKKRIKEKRKENISKEIRKLQTLIRYAPNKIIKEVEGML